MKPLQILDKNNYSVKRVISEGYDLIETNEEYSFRTATLTLSLDLNSPLAMDELIYFPVNSDELQMVYLITHITTDSLSRRQTIELIEYGAYINYLGLEVQSYNDTPIPTTGDDIFVTVPYNLSKVNSNNVNQLVHNFRRIGINLETPTNGTNIPLEAGFIKLTDLLTQVKETINHTLTFSYNRTSNTGIDINAKLSPLSPTGNVHRLNIFELNNTLTSESITDFYQAAYPILRDDKIYTGWLDYYQNSWMGIHTQDAGQNFPRNIYFYPNNDTTFAAANRVPESQLKYRKLNATWHIFLSDGSGTYFRPNVRKSLGINCTLNSNKSMGRYYLLYWDLVNKLEEHNNKSIKDNLRKNSVKQDYKLNDRVIIVNGNSNLNYYVSKTVKNLNSNDYESYITEEE